MLFIPKFKTKMNLKEVDSLLSSLVLPISYVFTPVNLEEEKKKFFESDTYNPVFKYSLVPNKNAEILHKLKSVAQISDVDPRISDLYIETIKTKFVINDLYNSVGINEKITKYSTQRYGFPFDRLFTNACLVLKGKVDSYNLVPIKYKGQDEKLTSKEIVNILEKTIKEFGFKEWSVIFSKRNNGKTVRVGVKEKEIVIGSDKITRSRFKMRKLIVHEIGSHIFRWYNGKNSHIPILSRLNTNDSAEIEEGFASYNENLLGVMGEKELKAKARMTYTTYLSKDLSFRELYNVLRASMTKESAFSHCLRVKKGLGDTSIPGVYTKGVVYFRGLRTVQKAIENDISIYEKLFAGKISLAEVSWVDDGLIPYPKLIINKEEFNSWFKKLGI